MILPSNNIKLFRDVATLLGIVKYKGGEPYLETSLFKLVTQAKEGGKGGYAFNIAENGSNAQDGTLIEGAEPYWDIWSTNQPGFWWAQLNLTDFTKSKIRHRLKYDSNQKYYASLGSFASYNHNALGPYLEGDERPIREGHSEVIIKFYIEYSFGNYNWSNVLESHKYYQVIVTKKDYPEIEIGSSGIKPIPTGNNAAQISECAVSCTVSDSTSSYPTLNPVIGDVNCWLCKADGSQRIMMPNMSGKLSLLFNRHSSIVGNIYINNDISIDNKLKGGTIDKSDPERDFIKFSPKRLRNLDESRDFTLSKIGIIIRDTDTSAIILSEERDTFMTYFDSPKKFRTNSFGETSNEYEFVWDSINSDFFNHYEQYGQQIVVNFYYNV